MGASGSTFFFNIIIVATNYVLQRGMRKGHQDVKGVVTTIGYTFGTGVDLVVLFQADVC